MKETPDQLQLIPPYCPNNRCIFHLGSSKRFYIKNGWTRTDKAPFLNQRYKCKQCKIQFSANTFSLDFKKKTPVDNEFIMFCTLNGVSNTTVSKRLKISESTLRNRITLMSHQSLLFEKEHSSSRITEDVAYDGFETFTYSQFSPCYVNTAVGSWSQFIYHNTFSPLNRKGRMTENQKIVNRELNLKYGPYPTNSVCEESVYVIQNLNEKAPGRTLFMDEHKSYQRALKQIDLKMDVVTINSKIRRDASNPLFPINRLHMLYRHCLSSQKRETISFQKHEAALLEKIQLTKVNSNFMKPKFANKTNFDPHAHEWSPAMYVGVAKKVLSFSDVFSVRKLSSQFQLDDREKAFLNRSYPYSRQKIAAA